MDMMQQMEQRSYLLVGTVLLALLVAGCTGNPLSGPLGTTPPVTPTAAIVRVSVATDGTQGDNTSTLSATSADGRFVAFASDSNSLVSGDTNGVTDVFLRDTCTGAPTGCTASTIRLSVATSGAQGDSASSFPAISGDGRFVVFTSLASNLVANDFNGVSDIFLRDTCLGVINCTPSTTRVSVASDGTEASSGSHFPAISASGRFIVFESAANDLVTADSNGVADIFLRDTCRGATNCTPSTVRVSVSSSDTQASADSGRARLSANGRFVAFHSFANNLVANDTNGNFDIFLRDTCFGVSACTPSTVRMSVASNGAEGDGSSTFPAISGDGRFVVFASLASNLVTSDLNGVSDIFLRDTCFGVTACTPSTVRVSVASNGAEASSGSTLPAISANGRFIAFESAANNLVTPDTNGVTDIFLRDTCFGAATCTPSTRRVSVTSTGGEGDASSNGAALTDAGDFVSFHSSASNLVPNDTNGVLDVFRAATGF